MEATQTEKVVLGYNFRGTLRGSATRYLLAYSQAKWEEEYPKMTESD